MNNLIWCAFSFFLLIDFCSNPLAAQENADSARIVPQALQMIAFPDPVFSKPYAAELSPKQLADLGFEQPNQAKTVKYEMRDGVPIYGQKYAHTSGTTVLLKHGTLASSYTFNKMAGLLREALQAEVIAIDLRGHGQSGGSKGDVSTPNQYAEDLEDIISILKMENPGQSILLAGHSMGGGIVLRHAESFPKTQVSGYLLFAPHLGNQSPTVNQQLNLENNFVKTHQSRGLGLRMLNEFDIHQYDSLKVVFYNLPEQVPLRSYTYRSMEASFPKDYKNALRKIDKPLLVLVGSKDEAFIAGEYPAVIKAYSEGECFVIENETHNGIRHSKEAMEKVRTWAIKHQLR